MMNNEFLNIRPTIRQKRELIARCRAETEPYERLINEFLKTYVPTYLFNPETGKLEQLPITDDRYLMLKQKIEEIINGYKHTIEG